MKQHCDTNPAGVDPGHLRPHASPFRSAAVLGSLIAVLGVLTQGCNLKPDNDHPVSVAVMVPLMSELRKRPHVNSAGDNAVVVYLDRYSGAAIDTASAGRIADPAKIRLLVRRGRVPDAFTNYQANSTVVHVENAYTRVAASNGSLSPLGMLVFADPQGRWVYAEQQSGGSDGDGNYLARVQIRPDIFVEYLYAAGSDGEHGMVARLVETWLAELT